MIFSAVGRTGRTILLGLSPPTRSFSRLPVTRPHPMPNFASALKEEIRRLARKEAKAMLAPLHKAMRAERKARAALRKQLAAGVKSAGQAARAQKASAAPAQAAGASRGGRALAEGWRKDTVRSTRKSLGLTQGQFAKLVGVS